MRMLTFAKRCTKEILRDPINIIFGLGFPVILLLLMSAIQANVPVDLFRIETLTPGVAVFGLSFMALFSSTLVARDRESSFLIRLYTTPLRASDYILGYMLPLIPIGIAQSAVCFAVAIPLGLPISINILYAIITLLPMSVFYISLGLLCGSLLTSKQVGGICGALLTNLSGWLSGVWFDLSLVGGLFEAVANAFPFVHAVNAAIAGTAGEIGDAVIHLFPVLIYSVIAVISAVCVFLWQMKKN